MVNTLNLQKKMFSEIKKEENLTKIGKLLFIFLTTDDEREKYAKKVHSKYFGNCGPCYIIEILNFFDSGSQLFILNL